MNRLCLSEEVLSAYLSGKLAGEERRRAEKHIACCENCRRTMGEAYDITKNKTAGEMFFCVLEKLKENKWGLISVFLIVLSFLFPRYFLQFLSAALLSGVKWVVEARSLKMMIMVREARKNSASASDTRDRERHR
ncbi:MAG: hypothetical protein GF408_03050 [Candidatus Omnitrophica bacterium]|nr:hypothetical protein [Candidatus Omnitrophota bacterium]